MGSTAAGCLIRPSLRCRSYAPSAQPPGISPYDEPTDRDTFADRLACRSQRRPATAQLSAVAANLSSRAGVGLLVGVSVDGVAGRRAHRAAGAFARSRVPRISTRGQTCFARLAIPHASLGRPLRRNDRRHLSGRSNGGNPGCTGPLQAPMLLGCFVLYLSVAVGGQQFFDDTPWDSLLLETGFLAIFLAPWQLSLKIHRQAEPSGLLLWLVWWLLFRLLFGSGLAKITLADPSWRDGTALLKYFVIQPLPVFTSWYAARCPPGCCRRRPGDCCSRNSCFLSRSCSGDGVAGSCAFRWRRCRCSFWRPETTGSSTTSPWCSACRSLMTPPGTGSPDRLLHRTDGSCDRDRREQPAVLSRQPMRRRTGAGRKRCLF